MIQKIEKCLLHQGRVRGSKAITFSQGINVIVGPNGSGKSSLLKAIYRCPDCKKKQSLGQKYRYFNSETMNPHRSDKYFRGIQGSIIRVRAMFSSHGETMRDVLRFMQFEPGDCLLLDEPEAGHDLRWILKIYKGLMTLSRRGCQIIMASHHPVFWHDGKIIELQKGYLKKSLDLQRKYLKYSKTICK